MRNINPRKIPRTQADVDKAETKGRHEGMNRLLTLVIWTLVDSNLIDAEGMVVLGERLKKNASALAEGYIKYADLEKTLAEEYDWRIELT